MGDARLRDGRGRLAPRDADAAELERRSAIPGKLNGEPRKRPGPRKARAAKGAAAPVRAGVVWSPKLEAAFCAALAETLNVRAAAARIGVSEGSVYGRRERSAGLRRLWRAAIREGYQQLELKLLEHALKGAGAAEDGFCAKTALALLGRWKGASASEEPAAAAPATAVTREGLRRRFRDMAGKLTASGQDNDRAS